MRELNLSFLYTHMHSPLGLIKNKSDAVELTYLALVCERLYTIVVAGAYQVEHIT